MPVVLVVIAELVALASPTSAFGRDTCRSKARWYIVIRGSVFSVLSMLAVLVVIAELVALASPTSAFGRDTCRGKAGWYIVIPGSVPSVLCMLAVLVLVAVLAELVALVVALTAPTSASGRDTCGS